MSLSEGKRMYSVISMRCVLPYTKVRRKSLSFIYFLLAFTNFRQFFSVTDRVRHFFLSHLYFHIRNFQTIVYVSDCISVLVLVLNENFI